MNRKDREITDKQEIFNILKKCSTLRIAVTGYDYPYVVPVTFGFEAVDGKGTVYFHCAKQGLKYELLERNPKVCIEADHFIKVEQTEHGITSRYESVIGFGQCHFLTDQSEILHGLGLLTSHYGYGDYPLDRCKGLANVLVGKIEVEEIYGKRNLPNMPTAADAETADS